MKKIIIVITSFLVVLSVHSQTNIRMNNFWGDMQHLSPAFIYDKYKAVANVAVRKQWLGVDGAPTTFFASGTTFSEKNKTQYGFAFIQDKIGYTSTSNLNFSFAYAINLSTAWQLHLGVGANYQYRGFDLSRVNMTNGTDNLPYLRLVNSNAFNADFGSEVTNSNMKMGFASHNLISLFSQKEALQTNTNFLYFKYYQKTYSIVDLSAGVCGIHNADMYGDLHNFQAEFSVTSYFKYLNNNGLMNKASVFDVGLFYRTQSEAGVIFGFDVNSSLHISYSYDYHFGALRTSSFGTNEIMLTFNIKEKPVCHNCWY